MYFKHHKRKILREELWDILHHGKGRVGHVFEFTLVALLLLSLAILPLELMPSFAPYQGLLGFIEIVTTSLFTVEYFLRIYAAPNRWKYALSFYGIVDLLSILPFYLGLFATQYVRIIRLVRFFKLGEIEAAAGEEEEEQMEHEMGLAEGEHVEYVVTRHPLYLFVSCIPPFLATVAGLALMLIFTPNAISLSAAGSLFLFAIIFLWKAWLDYSYDVIFITSHRLIFQLRHLLGRSINQVNYHAITNVKPSYPSLLSYVLRYGNLIIETPAAEPGHIELTTVRHHEHAAHIIMRKCFDSHGELMRREQPPADPPEGTGEDRRAPRP